MVYHAESFAFETYLIGYQGVSAYRHPCMRKLDQYTLWAAGSKPIASLLSFPRVHLLYLPEPPASLRKLPSILLAPFKILHQIIAIISALLRCIPHPPECLSSET